MQPHIEIKLTHFPKKCIVMDFNGTLVDTTNMYLQIWKKSIKTLLPTTKEQEIELLYKELLNSHIENLKFVMIDYFKLSDKLEELKQLKNEELNRFKAEDYTLVNGTLKLLRQLKDKFVLILHTNRDYAKLKSVLAFLGISELFAEIVYCSDLNHPKPDPAMLLDLIKRKDYKPEDLVYWGDNEVDKQYAENAGIDYVVTNTSFPRKDLVSIFTSQKQIAWIYRNSNYLNQNKY